MIENTTTDSQGYIAVDDARKAIIIVFRGSNSAKDI
jgi:hypothetical protein